MYRWVVIVVVALILVPFALADDCRAIRSDVNQLKAQLDEAQKQADLVNDPQHPEKEEAALARVHALAKKLADRRADLSVCEHPTPPLLSGTRHLGMAGIPDPQIAVGKMLVAAVDTSHVNFYNKSDFTAVTTGNIKATANVFAALQLAVNQKIHAKTGVMGALCDPAHPERFFDANGKLQKTSTCIYEFYDTRAYYDMARSRFWIIAAARNRLWPCATSDGKDGATNGYDVEPDPKDPAEGLCRPELAGMARRYIAVAVTKSGEDLSQGFFTYILMQEIADWPQFTVHGNYLVLNHRGGHTVQVFDAAALASGTKDGSVLEISPLLSFENDDLDPKPTTHVTLVNVHGGSDRVTYLLAGRNNGLVIYGLSAPAGNPSGKPTMMKSATIPVDRALGDGSRSNGVYFNGKLYFAYHTCTATKKNRSARRCIDYTMDVLRIPVTRSGDTLVANSGYADFNLGSGDVSTAVPAIEVTENEDIVTVFSRGFLTQRKPMGAHYAVIYHDLPTPSVSAVLHDPVGTRPSRDPGEGGWIDLGGISLDPVPDSSQGNKRVRVWMSHAYSNAGTYAEAVGAMMP